MRVFARIMGTSDPLALLGHDIFVDILSHLDVPDLLAAELVSHDWKDCIDKHPSGIWRGLALSSGVERVDIDACDTLAATGKYPLNEYDRRAIANNMYTLLYTPQPADYINGRAGSTPNAIPGVTPGLKAQRINWRYVVQSHYELRRAWALARCRVGWVTPGPNIAWRIKSVAEHDVLLTTSRMNGPIGAGLVAEGLAVVDRYTSEPLFSLQGLQGYSHLEAGRGFLAFNTAAAFEVWRNSDARARSTLPKIGKSAVAHSAVSHSHRGEFRAEDPESPLPRGHYEHFQTLVAPTHGRAYRMHVDHDGTEDAAAVFATCATHAIYIWHLEEDKLMETIERGPDDHGTPNYIELDDEYVFVCDDWQMHVYARETHAHLVSFPPLRASPKDIAALAFPLSLTDDFKAIPDEERNRPMGGTPAEGVPAPVGRAVVEGAMRGEAKFDDAVARAIAMHPGQTLDEDIEDVLYGFSACHFTSRDLICTAESGGVLVVRNYADVFAQCARMEETEPPLSTEEEQRTRHVAPEQRAKHVAEHSMLIGLGTIVKQLTTYRDHIVIATSFNVIVLDGRSFPDIPERAAATPGVEADEVAEEVKDEAVDNEAPDNEVADKEAADKVADHEADAAFAAPQAPAADADGAESDWTDDELLIDATEDEPLLPPILAPPDAPAEADQTVATSTSTPGPRPKLRAHVLLGNHQQSMKMSSCLQADARSIYLTYWASGETEDGPSDAATAPTPEALFGLGLCVKVWTFCA